MKKYFFLVCLLKFFVFVWPGLALADSSINGRWLDYYEEGDSVRVDRGVKVTTIAPERRAGGYLKTGFLTWNLEQKAISFRVKVSDWSKAKVISLIVGNGLKFENSATFDIRRRFVGSPNNEWVEVVVPPSAWNIDGQVDWRNIDSILFSVMDDGSERITAQIANIKTIDIPKGNGVVSITVDDGLKDTMQAYEILNQRGLKGTVFIDVKEIGNQGFISKDDLEKIKNSGWDVGGHNMGRLTRLSPEQLALHVETTSSYLKLLGAQGSDLYALPNGERNSATIEGLLSKFEYVFNIDGMANHPSYLLRTNVNRHSIDKHTSLALAKSWIDSAVENNEWVVINFHTFSDDWAKEEDWSIEDFTALLDYIQVKGIAVKSISSVLSTR